MSGIRIGIIGLGFMGKTHLAAYRARGANVVGVLEPALGAGGPSGNLETGAGPVDLSGVQVFASADEFFAFGQGEGMDAVSICTPTDTHPGLAIRALRAGLHVLVEKPVALSARDVRTVEAAATEARRVCMPAMVMRFWPGWAWLVERRRDGTYGRLDSLSLQRFGAGPTWNPEFYRDPSRSGGAMVDLHIHDTDFVYHLCGKPASVVSGGSVDRISTLYRFGAGGPGRVIAEGGWMHPGFAFTMRFIATFERATIVFDLAGGKNPVTVYANERADHPNLPTASGYEGEVQHFLDAVHAADHGRIFTLRASLDDAAVVADILAAERRSLEAGREVTL